MFSFRLHILPLTTKCNKLQCRLWTCSNRLGNSINRNSILKLYYWSGRVIMQRDRPKFKVHYTHFYIAMWNPFNCVNILATFTRVSVFYISVYEPKPEVGQKHGRGTNLTIILFPYVGSACRYGSKLPM